MFVQDDYIVSEKTPVVFTDPFDKRYAGDLIKNPVSGVFRMGDILPYAEYPGQLLPYGFERETVENFNYYPCNSIVTYAGEKAENIWKKCFNRSIFDNLDRYSTEKRGMLFFLKSYEYLAGSFYRGLRYRRPEDCTAGVNAEEFILLADSEDTANEFFSADSPTMVITLDDKSKFVRQCGTRRLLWREIYSLLSWISDIGVMTTVPVSHLDVFTNERTRPKSEHCGSSLGYLKDALSKSDKFFSFTGMGEDCVWSAVSQFVQTVEKNIYRPDIACINIFCNRSVATASQFAVQIAWEALDRPNMIYRTLSQSDVKQNFFEIKTFA